MENSSNIFVEILGICLVIIILIGLVLKYISSIYIPFAEERDFLKMELSRSYGSSRLHYKHELRRLYLAQIPFIGIMLADADKRYEIKRREIK